MNYKSMVLVVLLGSVESFSFSLSSFRLFILAEAFHRTGFQVITRWTS